MKIGQSIYSSRKKKGISQEELAALLDVSRQSISLWETDQTTPTLDKLQAMCNVLEVSMDELTGRVKVEEKKLDTIRTITPEERANRIKIRNKKLEIVGFILSLILLVTWIIEGLGTIIAIGSLIINLLCLKNKETKYSPYSLVITIVFLIASLLGTSYL